MRRVLFTVTLLSLLLSACLPASQPADVSPAPVVDLNATAAISVEQTLQALPSSTPFPSNTPVVVAATKTTVPSETPTLEVASATVTASTENGTITATSTEIVATSTQATISQTATTTLTNIPVSGFATTPTETLYPRFYGTLPPELPFGHIELRNKSKREVYISLQVTTADGYTTILEYPVNGTITTKAPAGKYIYVVWVGGKKLSGSFGLGKSSDLFITIFKDHVEVKAK